VISAAFFASRAWQLLRGYASLRKDSQPVVQPLSWVNEEEARGVGSSPEPRALQVGLICLPGRAQDENDFQGIAVAAVVGVQELI